MAIKFRIALIAAVALVGAAILAAATAQPYGPGAGMMGPGMMSGQGMMGSWMMGRRGFAGMCNPGSGGFADRIAELVKPTDAQRARFDEFKAASIKSAEIMRDACQTDVPATIVGRTEAVEKRMETMLQAVRAARPALEAFYATLSDEQKARLDANSHRGRFWH
jgi:hypothetical protein